MLYTPTEASPVYGDIVGLGKYSFMTPDGELLRKGDAESFPTWMDDHLGTGWALDPMRLSWHPIADGLAEAQYFFLIVDDSTGEAYQGIWKGIAIDCDSGIIISLHGGYA